MLCEIHDDLRELGRVETGLYQALDMDVTVFRHARRPSAREGDTITLRRGSVVGRQNCTHGWTTGNDRTSVNSRPACLSSEGASQ